ncbi:BON domain-containing protein [Microvirga sp. 17 mud 1-3]|uniref:BON domain-containing protein n=1 Tax=Microvirga sp. 17 mud 1-3 TaxID=2082949 RepID=UPI0013A59725|nr:BON domain-containing protein [Microvirga sp. 17 mud 1-3]
MANDRYRYDPDRYRTEGWRGRDESYGSRRRFGSGEGSTSGDRWREDDGYIARRGFGNRSSGYDRDERSDTWRSDAWRNESRRNDPWRDDTWQNDTWRGRDYGDSAGYGSGGSARDWRDVVGDDRRSGMTGYGVDYSRDRDYRGYGSSYDEDRYGSGFFGRGSRDYGEDRGFLERAGDEVRSWFGDEEANRRRDEDMRRAEQYHRGRGPKGYQRSDERIREDVNDRLTDDPHIDASEINVTVSGREVTLDGTVQNRFAKRHAEDIAESVSGVTHVQNNLRVQQSADTGNLSTGTGTGAGTTQGMEAARRRTTTSSGT